MCKEESKKKITILDLFLENRIKSLPPDMVEPDDRGTKEKPSIFPWEHVDICLEETIEVIPNRLPCPICGKPSNELRWIHFDSPQYTWENLYGREGAMSICTDCHCQVEFICVMMN